MRHAIGVDNGNWRSGDLAQFAKSFSELSAREIALAQILEIMGSEQFDAWYRNVYQLRKDGDQEEYERQIFEKLEKLNNAMSDVSDAKLCSGFGVAL